MGTGAEIAIISLAATGAATGAYSAYEGHQGRKEEKRARKVEGRIRDVQTARERRRAIREARVQRADIEAGAQATGVAGASGAITGAGTVGTQLAANLSFLDQVSELQDRASMFRERAASRFGKAQTASAVSGLAFTGASFGASGGFGSRGGGASYTKVGEGSAGLGKYRVG